MVKEISTNDTVTIQKLVSGGDGLGYMDGNTIFVPLVAPGDVVIPKQVRKARGVLFSSDRELVSPSDVRRDAPCPWFGQCGGCQWMHLPYDEQLRWKETVFTETVKRVACIPEVPPLKVHSSPMEFGYRHRIRLKYDGNGFGFYRRSSRKIVHWKRCMLLPDMLNKAVRILGDTVQRNDVQGLLKNLELAVDPTASSLTAFWIFEGSKRSLKPGTIDKISSALGSGGVKVAGQGVGTLKGPASSRSHGNGGRLQFTVTGIPMTASPGTFLQANPAVNETVVRRVLEHIGQGNGRSMLDLYCGNGNFSIPAALAGFSVTGVESSAGAVRDATECAPEGCSFLSADVTKYLESTTSPPGSIDPWDVVVVDPPRTGLPKSVASRLVDLSPQLMVYVSCEPSTLARDLARLLPGGYVLRTMELVDMFPQTPHVESLTVLERR